MTGTNSKLKLRAYILKSLKYIKQEIDNRVFDFNKGLRDFYEIEDKKILTKVIVKEFQGDASDYDRFLSLVLTRVAPKEAESCIFEEIMSDNISDSKKIYLIGILKEINNNADYSALINSVKEPEQLIELETENFAHSAIYSINQQIDFLDFYFASNLEDKIELVNNLIENSEKDEASIILSLILYTNDEESREFIIEKLGTIHSLFSIPPLQYALKNFKSDEHQKLIKKALSELKISGLREEISAQELYKKILSNSKPLSAWITNIDGASNYVLMLSREYENTCISFFSVVINLEYGIIDCFGFEDLERYEFREISKKIFSEDKVYQIPIKDAMLFLSDTEKSPLGNPPYEYFAWRTLTYDLEVEDDLNNKIKSCLHKVELQGDTFEQIKKSEFFRSWFIKTTESNDFQKLMDKINSCKNINEIYSMISKKTNKIFGEIFDKQVLHQSYILHLANQHEMSDILYSTLYNKEIKEEIKDYILKKSILFYYKERENSPFAKNTNMKVSKEIKKQWEKEF